MRAQVWLGSAALVSGDEEGALRGWLAVWGQQSQVAVDALAGVVYVLERASNETQEAFLGALPAQLRREFERLVEEKPW